jgi:hypothetical protein
VRTYGEAIDVRTDPRSDPWAAAASLRAEADGEARGGGGAGGSGGAGVDILSADELLGSARPAQFVWRGRLYLVREVLAHWVELGTWWTARGGAAGTHARRPAPQAPHAPVTPDDPADPADPVPSEAPRSVSVDVGAVEREVWRVEASVGRAATPGVFDLVRDVPARAPGDPVTPDRWRLARALD